MAVFPASRTQGSKGSLIAKRQSPWTSTQGMAAVIEQWQSRPQVCNNITLHRVDDATEGKFAPIPSSLAPNIQDALAKRGYKQLYKHQNLAIEHALAGRNVVVATPTASGKSLCYHLPVMQALSNDRAARALYLFPTKALCRDQESGLRDLMRDAGLDNGAVTYDGDTPGDARRAARERAGIVITNPDMLHSGILPHHTLWAHFFANIKYIVLDELHTYRGVFGSHVANVMRRLERIAAFHGSKPTFVFASATIGNPKEHAETVLGLPVELVDQNGAPQGRRRTLVYNPATINAELGIRESYIKCAVRIAADLVRGNVATIVFGQSRNNVEVMLKYLREALARDKIDPNIVQGYRGGYLPDTRRRIENGLRSGEVRCVVATNALELGIDIGALDAVVCAGYPGSLAALHQRFGRGGRRKGESLAVLITSSAPLDQFLAREPKYLHCAPIEEARIDPDNPEILIQHLKCAAFELPMSSQETLGNIAPAHLAEALSFLAQNKVLHAVEREDETQYHWASDAYPANTVSLRSLGWDNFVIINVANNKAIAEMDWRATHTMLHEQAIYQHEGAQYQVEKLDFENHKAFVRPVEPDYFTDAMSYTKVSITQGDVDAELSHASGARVLCGQGEVSVVEKVVGYKKIKYHTHENVGYGDVHLPEMQMHTTAFWLTYPEVLIESLGLPRAQVVDAARGVLNALHMVGSLGLMCDPRDLGHTLGQGERGAVAEEASDASTIYAPTLFLYDHTPGGIGLATRLFEERQALIERASELIETCHCKQGCPACIGPQSLEALNLPYHSSEPPFNPKATALNLLAFHS